MILLMLEPLFDECVQVSNYGSVCLELEYETCGVVC